MENTMTETNRHFSPRATLAAIGLKIRAMNLLTPIKEKVKIAQKTIKHEPFEKLQDALIIILAGAHGLVEINTRLRSDPPAVEQLKEEGALLPPNEKSGPGFFHPHPFFATVPLAASQRRPVRAE